MTAPAGPSPAELVERGADLLRAWDLDVIVLPSARARHRRARYLAGEDELRTRDLEDAWCDPEIDAIFCTRGGYGSVRILDLLDADRMALAVPKPVFGSSDITALLEWLRERLAAPGWFAPMIASASLLDDEVSIASLHDAVTVGAAGRTWTGDRARTVVRGRCSGTLVGGNLSLLAMTIGAAGRRMNHRDTIAVFEDVHEETYKLDGYLQALLRADWFAGVRGVVLGSWLECSPVEEIEALFAETLSGLEIPVVSRFDLGHAPGARTIPLGVRVELVADDAPRISIG